ncbi:MAG: hypothetical protein JNJ57_11465 [Saprospiraceae bacterium]|nr:hypothetical protein [Saprospiraceae bacterium]
MKTIIAALLIAPCALPAQSPITRQIEQPSHLNISKTVDLLSQNALLALLGMVALLGFLWVFNVWNECGRMNKQVKRNRLFSVVLCCFMGAQVLTTGCTAAQRVQAADIEAARKAEKNYCACHPSLDNRTSSMNSGIFNRYPYSNFANGECKTFCRHCGLKVYQRNN